MPFMTFHGPPTMKTPSTMPLHRRDLEVADDGLERC